MPKNRSGYEKLPIGHFWINQRAPYNMTQIFGTTLGNRHKALIKRLVKLHKTLQI
jgi:hypothetical protein